MTLCLFKELSLIYFNIIFSSFFPKKSFIKNISMINSRNFFYSSIFLLLILFCGVDFFCLTSNKFLRFLPQTYFLCYIRVNLLEIVDHQFRKKNSKKLLYYNQDHVVFLQKILNSIIKKTIDKYHTVILY